MSASPTFHGTSVAAQRIQTFLDGVKNSLTASGLFVDVRLQLDPYAITDVLKENFKAPAARVFIMQTNVEATPSGNLDVEMKMAIAVIAMREGRPDLTLASADMAALALAFDVACLIRSEPYFGLTKLTEAKLDGFRIATSEKSNDKGLAIVLVPFTTTLLRLIPERPDVAGVIDPSVPAGLGINLNGDLSTGIPGIDP